MINENDPVLSYPRLGKRTLLMFVIKRLGIFFFLFCIEAVIFVLLQVTGFFPGNIVILISNILAGIAILVFAISCAIAFLEYSHYSIYVNHGDVKVCKGFLSVTEYGFPYRKIKEVRLVRSLIDQILGISSVSVFVSGEESFNSLTVNLPFLEKDIALAIRDEILKRTQVEDIFIESGPHHKDMVGTTGVSSNANGAV